MARYSDIPQFTRSNSYTVNVGLDYIVKHYTRYVLDYGLDVSPDFQRGNVWTLQQKIRFVEYILRGGKSGLDIYINCPNWDSGQFGKGYEGAPGSWMVLVDGKQRLDAVIGFLNNEFPIFEGHYARDFEDKPRIIQANFRWHVNNLATREECLQWYLDLNSGGTVHSDDELDKVRGLLKASPGTYTPPSLTEVASNARLDRQVIQDVLKEEAEYRAKEEEDRRLAEANAKAAAEAKAEATKAKRAATIAKRKAAKSK